MSPRFFSAVVLMAVLSATSLFIPTAPAQDTVDPVSAAVTQPTTPAPGTAPILGNPPFGPATITAIMDENRTVKADLASLRKEIKRCTKMEELSFRVTCYDRVSKNQGFISAEDIAKQEKKLAEVGFWQISTQINSEGLKDTYMRIESSNIMALKNGVEYKPVLSLRCSPGRTDAFLDWKAPLITGSRLDRLKTLPVTYFPNSDPRIEEDWQISNDQRALFSLDAVSFVRNLLNKKKLTIEISPDNKGVESVYFDITGVENGVNNHILKNCYQ